MEINSILRNMGENSFLMGTAFSNNGLTITNLYVDSLILANQEGTN